MSRHEDEPGLDEADMVAPPKPRKRNGPTAAQTMGGVLFGFEQQIWRTAPPPQELVHHARPDASVPAGDGSFLTISMPDDWDGPHSDDEADADDEADREADADGAAEHHEEPAR